MSKGDISVFFITHTLCGTAADWLNIGVIVATMQ